MRRNKQFIILGNINAISYNEIFPYIANNSMWLGCNNGSKEYIVSADYAAEFPNKVTERNGMFYSKLGNTVWYTNIETIGKYECVQISQDNRYAGNEDSYPSYDNIDAINVDKVCRIPCDYAGIMAVPISIMCKHCQEQFEIIDLLKDYTLFDTQGVNERVRRDKSCCCNINGKATFARILVRYRQEYIDAHPELFG